jgi:hypothetical protein
MEFVGRNCMEGIISWSYVVRSPFLLSKIRAENISYAYGVERSLESVTNFKSMEILLLTWTFR